jgi:hypothetical protein
VTTVLWILSLLAVALGIAGTLIPGLPGAPLVFGGLLLAAWADGFQKVGLLTITVLALLTAASVAVDFVAASLGATRVGASRQAIVGAAVGTLVGLFFGLPGLIGGPFVGAVVGEYWARRNVRQAGKAGLGSWVGFLLGTFAKLVLAFLMVGIFAVSYVMQ